MTSQCRISAEQRAVLLTQDRAKRVYIAGPMTGIEDFNFPAFNAMADNMRAGGWHVENPADHGVVHGAEWADYLRYDVGRLATCEAIMLLPGWSKSKGANLEVTIARQLGMRIMLAEGAEPAPQPHPEPIAWMVGTAFWWTKEEADRDAAATGLPIVGLGPMTDRAAIELAECESMADMVAEREWAEHAGTGPVSSKVEAAFTQLHNDLHEAGETLAERDALLRELADAPPAAMEFRLQQKVKAALSASAEPSAPGVLPRAHDVNMFQRTAEPGAKS
ncbi:DUF4406 domain-containing protein [Pseudomonas asiatica]|uniref:DUF4406 domain-containing protein n=1 Tax=Pseudomonas asiatica TaxID=2219225 RepID=UPI001F37E84C|nr:DUF4406 domain-containing protein [Pseudomonas asiatica]